MNKRGFSHIEIIFAFVIFIAAVIFGLYFFSPLNSSRLVDSSLSYVSSSIEDNVTTSLVTYSVKIYNTGGQITDNIVAIPIDSKVLRDNINVRVEDYNGVVLPSKIERSNKVVIFKKESGWDSVDFAILKFSEDFDPTSATLNGVENPAFYQIASITNEDLYSEKKMIILNESYYSNYDKLKDDFKVRRADFGFSVFFSKDHAIISQIDIPSKGEVFSRTSRVQFITKDGSSAFADLGVRVW